MISSAQHAAANVSSSEAPPPYSYVPPLMTTFPPTPAPPASILTATTIPVAAAAAAPSNQILQPTQLFVSSATSQPTESNQSSNVTAALASVQLNASQQDIVHQTSSPKNTSVGTVETPTNVFVASSVAPPVAIPSTLPESVNVPQQRVATTISSALSEAFNAPSVSSPNISHGYYQPPALLSQSIFGMFI